MKSYQNSPLFQDETSMDALAAAGLNVSTLSWNKPTQSASTAVIATPKAECSGRCEGRKCKVCLGQVLAIY